MRTTRYRWSSRRRVERALTHRLRAVDGFEIVSQKLAGQAAKLVEACKERGVGMGTAAGNRIRAVTHLDVNRADIDSALKVIGDALAA